MNDATELLDLIGLVYDSVQDPSRWSIFLEKLFARFNGHMGGIHFFHHGSLHSTLMGASEPDRSAYRNYYSSIDPWMGAVANAGSNLGITIAPSNSVISDANYHKTEFYNDYGKKVGYHYGVAVMANAPVGQMVLAVVRESRYGSVTEQEMVPVKPLLPHLRRAFQFLEAFAGLDLQRAALLDCMDRLDRGLVLIETERVLCCNRTAERMASLGDGFYIDADGLRAAAASETTQLRRLISDALATSARVGIGAGGTLLLPRPSSKRPWVLTVSPHKRTQGQPMAAVLITDPESRAEPSSEIVARLFQFTPAETRLALLLADGIRVEDAADLLNIKVTTARTHLQRMLNKTSLRRQVELVLLLNKIPREYTIPPTY